MKQPKIVSFELLRISASSSNITLSLIYALDDEGRLWVAGPYDHGSWKQIPGPTLPEDTNSTAIAERTS
jgi:hypothetical protein